jgi:hypothetical protein
MDRNDVSHLLAITRLVSMVLATSSVAVDSISEHVGVGDPFRTGRQVLLDGSEKTKDRSPRRAANGT